MLNKKVIILFLVFCGLLYPQQENYKWTAKEVKYSRTHQHNDREYVFTSGSVAGFFARVFINGYWFFISELDGDNCPFYPSCSKFFVESVQTAGPLRGMLMFWDRFARDINFIDRSDYYPARTHSRYYDPVENYLMKRDSVSFTVPENEAGGK